jgi:hypothetical protein
MYGGNKMKRQRVLLAGMICFMVVFGVAFWGCDQLTEVAEQLHIEQVYLYSSGTGLSPYSGNGTIKIDYSVNEEGGDGYSILLNAGNIIDGRLTLNLPDSISDTNLTNLTYWAGQETFPVEPSDARGTLDTHFTVFEGNIKKGDLLYIKIIPQTGNYTDRIVYWYFNRPVTFEGIRNSHTIDEDGKPISYSYDINGVVGWNKLHYRPVGSGATITSNLNNLPSGFQWVFVSNGS